MTLQHKVDIAIVMNDYDTLLDLLVIHASDKKSYCLIYEAMIIIQDRYDYTDQFDD